MKILVAVPVWQRRRHAEQRRRHADLATPTSLGRAGPRRPRPAVLGHVGATPTSSSCSRSRAALPAPPGGRFLPI